MEGKGGRNKNWLSVKSRISWSVKIYHHRKDDGGSGRFNDPEEHQAGELDEGEQVNLPQRNMSQVDEVWLVLSWHPKQLQPVEELSKDRSTTGAD